MLAKWRKNYYNSGHAYLQILNLMTKKNEKKSIRSQQGQNLSALWLCFLMFVFGYLAASWFDVNKLVIWVNARLTSHPNAKHVEKQLETSKPAVEQHPKLEFYTLLTNDEGLRNATPVDSSESRSKSIDMQSRAVPEKTTMPTAGPSSTGPMELDVTGPVVPASKISSKRPHSEPVPKQTLSSAQSGPKPLYIPPYVAPKPIPTSTMDANNGRYIIQVGSFRSLTEAKRIRDKLGQKGYVTAIVPVMQQSTYWYRVIVGPFSSASQAQEIQSTLSHQEHISGMIRKE